MSALLSTIRRTGRGVHGRGNLANPDIHALPGLGNLYLWLRRVTELIDVEARLSTHIPGLVIGHRAVLLLRTVTQRGHILDPQGRSVSVIPTAV